MMKANWLTTAAAAALIAMPGMALAQSGGQSPSGQSQSGQDAYRQAETPGRPAVPNGDAEYSRSMERLFQAAQRLREAVQAMAQQPPGEQRNSAMDTARKALLETQEVMSQTAAANHSSPRSGSGSSSSGSSNSNFGSSGSGHSQNRGSGGSSSGGSGSSR